LAAKRGVKWDSLDLFRASRDGVKPRGVQCIPA